MMSDDKLNSTLSIKRSEVCRICGASSKCAYYGVISCSSCKTFFRRNAHKTFECSWNNNCEINLNTRHVCTACRLQKCFQRGMSTDLFRPAIRVKSTVKVHEVQRQPEVFQTLNLLRSDASLLTSVEWTLLTNLYYSYKEANILSIGQRIVNMKDIIEPTDAIYQTLVQEWIQCAFETTGECLRSNEDLCQLSYEDRSIICHTAADQMIIMASQFTSSQVNVFGVPGYSNIVATVYGKHTVALHLQTLKHVDSDLVMVKLGIAIFALSEITHSYSANAPMHLTNPIEIFQIQNKYAVLTWKYLLYKYGHDRAVKRFLNLISWFNTGIHYMHHVQSVTPYVDQLDLLVDALEVTIISDSVDK